MKFNFGMAKPTADRSLEEETLKRWRAAATKENTTPVIKEIDLTAETSGNQRTDEPSWVINTASKPLSLVSDKIKETPKEIKETPKVDPNFRSKVASIDSRLSIEDDLHRRFGSNIKAAIGPGTVIEGKLSFENPVRIDGTLIGEISSTSSLIVGEQGTIKANLKVNSLVVLGQVIGNVNADDLVEIRKGGRLEADIKTARLVIEDGGFFRGKCNRD